MKKISGIVLFALIFGLWAHLPVFAVGTGHEELAARLTKIEGELAERKWFQNFEISGLIETEASYA